MVLPLILSALGGALGTAGVLGPIGAIGGAALGSGLGSFAETGDLETGIMSGIGAFAGGHLLGPILGGIGGGGAGSTGASLAGRAGSAAAPSISASFGPGVAGIGSIKPVVDMAGKGIGGISGLGGGALDFITSPSGAGVGIGSSIGSSLFPPSMTEGMRSRRPAPTGVGAYSQNIVQPEPGFDSTMSEFNFGFRNPSAADIRAMSGMARGGMVRRMQEGGIAQLAQGAVDGQMAAPASLGGNEKDVVVEAVRAIKGESQNAEMALGAFLAMFGEDALRDLVDRVQSGDLDRTVERGEGKLEGPGDGMEDLIPASIEGEEDVLLSDGEFVVPADVVSSLGNGSSDAGARSLEGMMDRVRTMKNGRAQQPPRVPQREMLPA